MPQVNGSLPMQSDWPRPTCVVWCTASQVRVPDLDTIPETEIKKTFYVSSAKTQLKHCFNQGLYNDIKCTCPFLSWCDSIITLSKNRRDHITTKLSNSCSVYALGMMAVNLLQNRLPVKVHWPAAAHTAYQAVNSRSSI